MDPDRLATLAWIGALSFVLSFAGAAVGLVLGQLRLVSLIAVLGSPIAGVSTNLAVSGLGALAGAWRHARGGRVHWRSLLIMGIPSAIGVLLGTALMLQLNRVWSYLVIGTVLVISGWNLFCVQPEPSECEAEPEPPAGGETLIGLGLGALTALTGLMLGSLRLPVMMRAFRLDAKAAAGSNMAIGCLTAGVGTAAAWWAVDLGALITLAPPTMLGSYIGSWLTGKLRQETVKSMAGVLIAFSGAVMLGQGTGRLISATPDELAPLMETEGLEECETSPPALK